MISCSRPSISVSFSCSFSFRSYLAWRQAPLFFSISKRAAFTITPRRILAYVFTFYLVDNDVLKQLEFHSCQYLLHFHVKSIKLVRTFLLTTKKNWRFAITIHLLYEPVISFLFPMIIMVHLIIFYFLHKVRTIDIYVYRSFSLLFLSHLTKW